MEYEYSKSIAPCQGHFLLVFFTLWSVRRLRLRSERGQGDEERGHSEPALFAWVLSKGDNNPGGISWWNDNGSSKHLRLKRFGSGSPLVGSRHHAANISTTVPHDGEPGKKRLTHNVAVAVFIFEDFRSILDGGNDASNT